MQIPEKYLLRWVFNYYSGMVRRGCWSQEGTEANRAYNQDKAGLVTVEVESKDIHTNEIKTVFSVPSWNYDEFQWMASAVINPMEIKGKVVLPKRIFGCVLVAKTHKYNVTIAGNTFKELRIG